MTHSDPTIYLNGRFVPKSAAAISVDERGMFYGDGVYEVLRFYAGRPLAMDLHVDRMRKSLSRIEMAEPEGLDRFLNVAEALLEKNKLTNARFYWQITRGASPRNANYPDVPPTELVIVDPAAPLNPDAPVPTLTATLMPDERWANCWIKSLMLLPNVLASNAAHRAGFDSAILHRDGTVTEATNSNAMIVRAGELWTHPANRHILNGVTRQLVLRCAREIGVTVREQTYTTDQLLTADEVLLTGTTIHVTTITKVDQQTIGDGKPGPVTQRLHDALTDLIANECLQQVG
jgi:D-alanine transaminase